MVKNAVTVKNNNTFFKNAKIEHNFEKQSLCAKQNICQQLFSLMMDL